MSITHARASPIPAAWLAGHSERFGSVWQRTAGHKMLAVWMSGFGTIERVGVEGTGTYGASVARHLARMTVTVIEVDRPNRQQRRQHGKSDQLDAIEADS